MSKETLSESTRVSAVEAVLAALGAEPTTPGETVAPMVMIDAQGHWEKTEPFRRNSMDEWEGKDFDSNIRQAAFLNFDLGDQTPEQRALTHRLFFLTSKCHICAKSFGFNCSDDGMTYTASEPCTYPGGMGTFDVLLAIPSGKIVFANDLRSLVVIERPEHDVNSKLGQRQHTEAHAAAGMVIVATGNTCPGIWQQADQSIAIANYRPNSDDDAGDLENLTGIITPEDQRGTQIGSIDTSLWDYCAMDFDRFHALCNELDYDPEEFDITVATVEPGTYAFTVEGRTGRDTATEVYSRITKTDRVAPPIATIDTGTSDTLTGSNAYKTMLRMGRASISGNQWGSIQFLLTVNGNGFDWTDGFYRDGSRREDTPFRAMREDDPETHPLIDSIPLVEYSVHKSTFLGQETISYVYPFSRGYGGLVTVPENVDPWWLGMCLILAKALDAHPEVNDPKRQPEKAIQLTRQTLVYLLEIVEKRGGIEWIKPYLDAWAAINLNGTEKTDA